MRSKLKRWLLPVVVGLVGFGAASASAPIASAAERKLTGAEIETVLSGNTVTGVGDRGAWGQFFDKNGDTRYVRGSEAPSVGAWKVQGDQYCSQWPPAAGWACYDVTADLAATPPTLTWIGESGTKYPGKVKTGNAL